MPALCARDAYMVIRITMTQRERVQLGEDDPQAQGQWLCEHGWIPTYGGPRHADMTHRTVVEETRPLVTFEQILWRVHLLVEDDDDCSV